MLGTKNQAIRHLLAKHPILGRSMCNTRRQDKDTMTSTHVQRHPQTPPTQPKFPFPIPCQNDLHEHGLCGRRGESQKANGVVLLSLSLIALVPKEARVGGEER
jgi:hypothetical protein